MKGKSELKKNELCEINEKDCLKKEKRESGDKERMNGEKQTRLISIK